MVEEGEPVPKGGGTYKVGKPYSVNGRTYVPQENPNYRAEGIASWYGPDFHGRLTANGEVYNMHGISAAHPTLPLPSYARVTNLKNGRSIIVRVNDRGPYHRNRVIDLSIGTAKALDFYHRGIARVRVEYVGRAPIEGSDDTMLLATLREQFTGAGALQGHDCLGKAFIASLEDDKRAACRHSRSAAHRPASRARPAESVLRQRSEAQTAGAAASAEDPPAGPRSPARPPWAALRQRAWARAI